VSTRRAPELRSALGLVEALECSDAAVPLSRDVLLSLQALFNADLVSYHEARGRGRHDGLRVPDGLPAERSGISPELNPLFRDIRVRPEAARLSDFLCRRAVHANPYYDANMRPLQMEYQLAVGIGSRPGRCLILERGGSCDFSERDRELLSLLRPHFVAWCRRHDRERRVGDWPLTLSRASNASARFFKGGSDNGGLTLREREVLDWVGEGLTNKEIAARLAISPQTVRKHLENAYAKLDVHTRTAAVRAYIQP
jgi:DNA-binding CsgD family transcriptional regulator